MPVIHNNYEYQHVKIDRSFRHSHLILSISPGGNSYTGTLAEEGLAAIAAPEIGYESHVTCWLHLLPGHSHKESSDIRSHRE